jgi:hypothetical protein
VINLVYMKDSAVRILRFRSGIWWMYVNNGRSDRVDHKHHDRWIIILRATEETTYFKVTPLNTLGSLLTYFFAWHHEAVNTCQQADHFQLQLSAGCTPPKEAGSMSQSVNRIKLGLFLLSCYPLRCHSARVARAR